jgi:hypothetical protein
MAKRKVNLGGQMVDAEEVSFQPDSESGGEQWSHYTLLDGTSLKVKAVLMNALRIEGMYGPNGDPVYSVNASIVVSSSSPEPLRKKE